MKSFKITGSYLSTKQIEQVRDETVEIQIPFLDENEHLRFGIGNIVTKLHSNNVYPSEDGLDFLCFAGLVYLADTKISRVLHSQDSWTREIHLILPVYNFEKWSESVEIFTRMLNFLTGDRWMIQFTQREKSLVAPHNESDDKQLFDIVTLFSGGMDSLIAVINNLEQNKNIAFVSHAGDPFTKNAQKKLLTHINEKYPEKKPTYFDLWTDTDARLMVSGGRETSTRSRSFLFISFGICILTGVNGPSVLQVPENALIALNVPLDSLRVGSHSTRTTHPFYLEMWNEILSRMNINACVKNPYWNKTKGEMADECLNKNFLYKVIADSMSCSSPQKIRYKSASPQHCGYCVPCIIRRAAMAKAFGPDNDPTKYYAPDVSKIRHALTTEEGVQLRSFEYAISRLKSNPSIAKPFIFKSGPLSSDAAYIDELASVYTRGLMEVDDFIQHSISKKDQAN